MTTGTAKKRIRNQSSLILILTDLFSFCLSYTLAILIRVALNPLFEFPLEPLKGFWLLILINLLIMLLIFSLMGLYRGYGTVAVVELRNLTLSLGITYIIMAFSAYMIGQGERLSRVVFIISLVLCLVIVPLSRFIVYNRFSRFKSWGVRVAVIGSRDHFQNITTRLHHIHRLGFNPEIILCTDSVPEGTNRFEGVPIEEFSRDICSKIREEGIDIAFYSSRILAEDDPILAEISTIFPTVYYVLPESNLSSLWVDVTDLLGRPALKVRYHLLDKGPQLIKRMLEMVSVCLILLITLPFTLIASLLVYLEDRGPVFYTQDRLGQNGKHFKLLKFRTMVMDAESILDQYLAENPEARKEYEEFHKLEKDPRITHVGSILRKFSIDEVPQFLNVLHGDMNLVGPRAYMVHELDINNPTTQTILRVRPGVTGWWQVMGRNEATFSDRQRLDVYYIYNWSLWTDYYILIKTIWIILSGQGK